MSTILKSNKVSSGENLGNLNGILGSQDWSLFLDFSRDKYAKKISGVKTELSLTDALTAAHNFEIGAYSTPKTMSKDGVISDVSANNQIRTWRSSEGLFGLLIEARKVNKFTNSATPVEKTISVTAGLRMAASCKGSGYLTISGTNLIGSPITVREVDGFKALLFQDNIASTITVTPSGTLTHAQIEDILGFNLSTSPIKSGAATNNLSTRKEDLVKINDTLLQQVISSGQYTVLMQTVPMYPRANLHNTTAPNETRLVVRTPTNQLTLGISRAKNPANTNQQKYIRVLNHLNNGTSLTAFGGVRKDSTANLENFVYASTSEGVTTAMNDYDDINKVATTNAGRPSEMYIGSVLTVATINVGGCFILTKLAVYDRVLSDSEITKIVKSWV